MAQPQAYNRTVDFTQRDGDDTDHPALNQELDAAALSINEIRDNLALIQRDDGALKNGIVTADSLAPDAFDAVLANVNEAVGEAQDAAASALTSATTANAAKVAAEAAAAAALLSQNASALNAVNSAASAAAAAGSEASVAADAAAAAVSEIAAELAKTNAEAAEAAATAQAVIATTGAGTATTQAGIATTQAGISTAQAVMATAQTVIATAQADTSTTQAGIATAQAAAAVVSAAAAAASAASTGLPALAGKALNMPRVKADESGYEMRTAAQVLADIGAAKAGADNTITSMTALTAGGLPDNSVLTADIANAQITPAKLSGGQTGSAPAVALRGWVRFNGSGTVAVIAGINVSSVTDNGTGNFTINHTISYQDASYGMSGNCQGLAVNSTLVVSPQPGRTASACSIWTTSCWADGLAAANLYDAPFIDVFFTR